ncbi:GntR family transcriptional regulator [Nonomuraea sp. H19]|uniref:GntR family transcriptional regulator n=1 Tax=Nonomuraea sp. H19 TaxID=3452206 RepID=UPI003F8C41A7
MSRQVYETLREAIVEGRLQPGQRVVELDVARQLSVSQTTVRAALDQLAHDGLVLRFPRRGSYVASIEKEQARHAYEVRATLEPLAVRAFCTDADDTAIKRLEELLHDLRETAARDDLTGFVEADLAFHHTVWEASGNTMLARVWPLLEAGTRSFATVTNRVYYQDLAEVAAEHVALFEALATRNAETAERLAVEHVNVVWQRAERADAGGG